MTRHHRADRDRILAFRLSGHHLVGRQPLADLEAVAGACGIRNTPPGSSLLALHARLTDLTPVALDTALTGERTLVEVLGMRISPHPVPASRWQRARCPVPRDAIPGPSQGRCDG